MSLKEKLRTIFLCALLECGCLAGVPMRPEQIADLLRGMNQPRLAEVLPDEEAKGDGPPPRTLLT